MPEIGTSGSMSGDGKRSGAEWPKLPRPSSTLPTETWVPISRPINADRRFNQAITTSPGSRGRLVQSLDSTEAEGCRHAARLNEDNNKCANGHFRQKQTYNETSSRQIRSRSRFHNSARRIFCLSRPTHWFAKSCGVQRASDTYRRSGGSCGNEFCRRLLRSRSVQAH